MAKRYKMSRMARREAIDGFLFASPWLLGFLFFSLGPILASLVISFFRYDIYSEFYWVGVKNYINLFQDQLFWTSLYNSLYYTIFAVPLGIIIGLTIAMLLNQKILAMSLFRTIYYLPAVISGVAVAILWVWVLDPSMGLINILLEKIGVMGPLWLQDPKWSKPSLILMSTWGAGGGMVIYLAGLQGIPTELYEAAKIDGAGLWSQFNHITIPMMRPVIFFNLIMGMINALQVFTQPFIMTGGGPLNSTLLYALYLYQKAFSFLQMGSASAMAWIMFLIIMGLTILIFKSSSRWVYYSGAVRGR